MDRIKSALERARLEHANLSNTEGLGRNKSRVEQAPSGGQILEQIPLYVPDKRQLEDRRIIAFDSLDSRSAYFDMLRTQVLQLMGVNQWRRLAITSPTPECGKTVVSINLAMSIARLGDRQPILVDLDLRRPQIATYLGISPSNGVEDVLSGRCSTFESLFRPDVGNKKLCVLANSNSMVGASEVLSSSAMAQLVEDVTQLNDGGIQIFDLPPMLTSDDLLAFLPKVDCILLVIAVGQSTIHHVEECKRLLASSNLLGVVLNKAPIYDRSVEHAVQYGYPNLHK